jgi:uncharacterized membrane protein YeaQ/YmgE (transglycosylase-associated protein family)
MPNVFAGRIDVDQRAIVFNFEHIDSLACSILNSARPIDMDQCEFAVRGHPFDGRPQLSGGPLLPDSQNELESKVGIISWLVLGLIAGFIGSKIVNKSGKGFFLDIALGIVGAVVGGFLFSLFGAQGITGLNVYSMIVAVIGSVVVLWGYHAVTGR